MGLCLSSNLPRLNFVDDKTVRDKNYTLLFFGEFVSLRYAFFYFIEDIIKVFYIKLCLRPFFRWYTYCRSPSQYMATHSTHFKSSPTYTLAAYYTWLWSDQRNLTVSAYSDPYCLSTCLISLFDSLCRTVFSVCLSACQRFQNVSSSSVLVRMNL